MFLTSFEGNDSGTINHGEDPLDELSHLEDRRSAASIKVLISDGDDLQKLRL